MMTLNITEASLTENHGNNNNGNNSNSAGPQGAPVLTLEGGGGPRPSPITDSRFPIPDKDGRSIKVVDVTRSTT